MAKNKKINVQRNEITIIENKGKEYISLTDMLKAKDGDFFISDWLRNRNTVEYLGIWESVYNPDFNYGEFAIIKSQIELNKTAITQMKTLIAHQVKLIRQRIKLPVWYVSHGEFIFVATEAYYGNFGPFQPLVTKTY